MHSSRAKLVWAAISDTCQSEVRNRVADQQRRCTRLQNQVQGLGLLQDFQSPAVAALTIEISNLRDQVEHCDKALAKAQRLNQGTMAVCDKLIGIEQELRGAV